MNRAGRTSPGLVARLKHWGRDLRALPPGYRFRALHERHTAGTHSMWRRAGGVAAGLALVLFGLFELVVPGPGILFILLGGALLAREFRRVAALMDVTEVRLRRLLRAKSS